MQALNGALHAVFKTHTFNHVLYAKNMSLCPCPRFLYLFIYLMSPLSWRIVIINTNGLTNKQAQEC